MNEQGELQEISYIIFIWVGIFTSLTDQNGSMDLILLYMPYDTFIYWMAST